VKRMKAVIKSSSNLIPVSPTTITKENNTDLTSEIKALRQNTAVEVWVVWKYLLSTHFLLDFCCYYLYDYIPACMCSIFSKHSHLYIY